MSKKECDSDNYSEHSGSLLATECKNDKEAKQEISINIPDTDIIFIIMMHRHMHNCAYDPHSYTNKETE
jgi:hypothetical protein